MAQIANTEDSFKLIVSVIFGYPYKCHLMLILKDSKDGAGNSAYRTKSEGIKIILIYT